MILFSSNYIAKAEEENRPIIASIGYSEPRESTPIDANTTDAIDKLTKQIILKIIELEKFNLHYRMEVGKQGRWAGWRYALFQESNYCLNLSSGIFNTCERTSHFKDHWRVSAPKLENSSLTSMIGYIIGASAAALELGITEFHDLKAKQEGFSPTAANQHVLTIKSDLDKLFCQRDSLIQVAESAPLLHPRLQIDLAEGKVLKDLRDLTLLEYQKFHISARRFVAFQKAIFFLDMTKYTCDAVGSFMSVLALHKRDRRFNLPCGIMYDIGGSLIISTPLISRGIGILAQKVQTRRTASIVADVQARELSTLQADETALKNSCRISKNAATDTSTPLSRIAVYRNENSHFANELESILKRERAGKRTATQNIAAGAFTGSCHLTSGIMYTTVGSIAGGKRLRDGRITNYNLAAGAIVSLPGNATAILDTLRIQVQAEINRHKTAKAGKLPSQLFAANLAQLDQMEEQLTPNAR